MVISRYNKLFDKDKCHDFYIEIDHEMSINDKVYNSFIKLLSFSIII